MFDVQIKKYSKKGHGIGEIQKNPNNPSSKVEVVGSVIGDQLKIDATKRKKRIYIGELLEVVHPSKDRTEPRCPHATICGGCTWQQVSYTAQLDHKESYIKKLFAPFLEKSILHPIIPCSDPWAYRNKMEFTFSQNKEGDRFLGLIMVQSRGKVVNLQECHIASSWVMPLLSAIRKWWEGTGLSAYHPSSDSGTFRTLTIREGKRTSKKMVILTVSGNQNFLLRNSHLKQFKETILEVMQEEVSIFLRIHRIQKGKPSDFYEMHLHGPAYLQEQMEIGNRSFTFNISPSSFFQPNTLQAEKLYARALEMAAPTQTMEVYDLYCGIATLGILFAPYVKRVYGVELNPYAVCDAETNIEANNLSNIHVAKGDVGEVLNNAKNRPDLVILDPPRSGLDPKALENLLRMQPMKILYISCNPETQSSNILTLIQNGYKLEALQPVDQFPHTPHLENIALLTF